MRRRFITSDASELHLHDHVAWCGEGTAGLDAIARDVFSAAAGRGEQMLLVSDPPDPERLAGLDDADELLGRGALQVAGVEETYRNIFDLVAQLAAFTELVDRALGAGYSGLCVVGDNSRFVANDSEGDFAAWLAWETAADRLQAVRPVTGVCYFDRQIVPPDRLKEVASIHPVLSSGLGTPMFQIFVDGDALRLVGEVDALSADSLHRTLASAATSGGVVDVSGVVFMDHRALLTLDRVARERGGLRIRGVRPFLRRVWDLLGVAEAGLEFADDPPC